MPLKDILTQKIIDRLDRIDRKVLEQRLVDLSDMCGVYREIFEEVSEGVLLVNGEGAIEWFNSRALDLLGLPVNLLSFKTKWVDEIADPSISALFKKNQKKIMSKKIETLSVLYPRERRLRITFLPISAAPRLFMIMISDQTAGYHRDVERERIARLEDLMRLTAGIAHEIGNPLNALSIHMQLLKKEAVSVDVKKKETLISRLDVMDSEIKRLDGIIKNFLKATRRPPARFQMGSLGRLVQEVLTVVRPEAELLGISIDFKDDQKLAPFHMDRSQLYQALLNLIKNAIEAMPSGGKLKLQLTHRGKLAALRIEDTGTGISDESMPLIFNAFYTTKDNGTGLGLTSVLQSISEHGGKIDVASKPNKGTVFTLYLPIRMPKLQISKDVGT